MGNDRRTGPDGIERVTNGTLTALIAVVLICAVLPMIVSQILGLSAIESIQSWAGLSSFQAIGYLIPSVMAIGAIAVIVRLFTSSRE